MPQEIQVRVYKDARKYEKEAKKLVDKGWQVISVTDRRPRPTILNLRPQTELVVTYTREKPKG